MINYSRLGYEIKRDLSNFSSKISKTLKRPKEKFVQQMVYGILASNSVHLSEISRSLKEPITLKKTIKRLSRNLHDFEDSQTVTDNYLSMVKPATSWTWQNYIKETTAWISRAKRKRLFRAS